MTAYYNEHDPFAAAWLRELIADKLIAPGEVDERSIEDVTPNDLRPFRQCHFFAGVGVWSLAARLAGIADDAPLWSGSCPCQPFSSAGKGGGFDDERHLWPAFHYLIEQCGPAIVVGEQVAGTDGDAWLDLVSADMDATGYAFGAAETVAAGFGAPHKRSRNYWMAHRLGSGLEGLGGHGLDGNQPGRVGEIAARSVAARGDLGGLADSFDDGFGQHGQRLGSAPGTGEGGPWERERVWPDTPDVSPIDRLAAPASERHNRGWAGKPHDWRSSQPERFRNAHDQRPGPLNGFWSDADWLRCRDEKWRPVESGTFPLVDAGTFRNRVGLLRGAGNAITLGQAVGWLQAVKITLSRF